MKQIETLLQECIDYAIEKNLAPAYKNAAIHIAMDEKTSGSHVYRTDNGEYKIIIQSGLPENERKAMVAHELAHIYCGHCDIPATSFSASGLDSLLTGNQKVEREAIRMAMHLYPDPKAHIGWAVTMYNEVLRRQDLQPPAENTPPMKRIIKKVFHVSAAAELHSLMAGNRTHPGFTSSTNEICNEWKHMAAEGLCEPPDMDFLKNLPAPLQSKISILHDHNRRL